ncbi:hypothetical protein K431DRAFT_308052 [Polychaeton citri CBS 116435]|uniref:T6SS Phospholipase effector Tle1-like catalytic domain-containing protein n=1 Tax=Polychaeton citri CBS 116435 TaxID=1314669 RepID=A0A9P4PYE0_9PEZI|nr:hypothetical protein K431DRAFT_308052 [Polychaeton citri CBS 116435]
MEETSHLRHLPPSPGTSKKALILCFDGTGNKFTGTPADTNIVKIFSFLDREDPNQFHYYQPGIGTYTKVHSLSKKSTFGRFKSWYLKAKDQAVGHSFGEHVMAGYKFLMRYYSAGDDIYMFGFSRGAYTARFLAQMLDYVGLLSCGNEEMLRFAWKTFAKWQSRTEDTAKERQDKRKMFKFMDQFRMTFSRPIDPIRFLGLFDCVNSVPQFEAAWMGRTKFPYTAMTSARVIRHAVAIDERRAKFRQDLISGQKPAEDFSSRPHPADHFHLHHHRDRDEREHEEKKEENLQRPSIKRHNSPEFTRYKPSKHRSHQNLHRPMSSSASQISVDSTAMIRNRTQTGLSRHDEEEPQDILEVWFAGQHSDVGGGWEAEERPVSDLPLIWMLREARRAGMPVDEAKLEKTHPLFDDVTREETFRGSEGPAIVAPAIAIDGQAITQPLTAEEIAEAETTIKQIGTATQLHDMLSFGGGLGWSAVCAWQVMEHLPFRRMDLQKDGSWKPISWPLPRGEVRDIPSGAIIHSSVLRRMELDESYRPGNVIVGGGGRGVRRAPESAGTGTWRVIREAGDLIGECVVKIEAEEIIGQSNGVVPH